MSIRASGFQGSERRSFLKCICLIGQVNTAARLQYPSLTTRYCSKFAERMLGAVRLCTVFIEVEVCVDIKLV